MLFQLKHYEPLFNTEVIYRYKFSVFILIVIYSLVEYITHIFIHNRRFLKYSPQRLILILFLKLFLRTYGLMILVGDHICFRRYLKMDMNFSKNSGVVSFATASYSDVSSWPDIIEGSTDQYISLFFNRQNGKAEIVFFF